MPQESYIELLKQLIATSGAIPNEQMINAMSQHAHEICGELANDLVNVSLVNIELLIKLIRAKFEEHGVHVNVFNDNPPVGGTTIMLVEDIIGNLNTSAFNIHVVYVAGMQNVYLTKFSNGGNNAE